jgi:hypothetical protein
MYAAASGAEFDNSRNWLFGKRRGVGAILNND